MNGRVLWVAVAVVALALLMVALPASPAHAGGVVTECDEAHLLTALSGGGTVTFACSDYIYLTNPITISANTTIDGSGQSVEISGGSAGRIFKVNSGVSLTLHELWVAWGKDTSSLGGGAIYSDGGKLTITNSRFTDSSTSGFGGGVMIYNGTLTVKDSTFSGNSASLGGGITSYNSTVTVSGSTFASNSTVSSQIADGSGGGIYAEGGQVTVSNSTFFRNTATGYGGGIAGDSSTITVTNSTFSRNTADKGGNALERSGSGSMMLRNTIVAYSVAGANCAGSITDGGGNLSYPDTSCPGINRNPLLQTLNDNGGPTFTMLLGLGSPAIDAANDATCAAAPINNLDQRGMKRPLGAHCDIGAVEQQLNSTSNVLKVPDDYPVIQSAIDAATAGDEIWVAQGIYEENLSITKGITLSGGWDAAFTERTPGDSTISGMGAGRAISITCAISDTVVTVDGFTVESGNATGLGGAPEMLGEAAEIADHAAALAPDPLTPAEHEARLRAELAGVVARGLYPGGSAAYRAMLARVQQQIGRLEPAGAQSQATRSPSQQDADCGGGIYSWNASFHLLNSTLLGNTASLSGDGCGGGVFVGQSPPAGVLIQGNTLRQNIASAASSAQGSGGGLYAIQTPGLVVADNLFQENAAMSAGLVSSGEGGGLFLESSPGAVVRDNQFVRNTASSGWESQNGLGGGALVRNSDGSSVTYNAFRENLGFVHAQGGGGGLAVVKSAQVTIADNDVTGNWGGMYQRDRAGAEGGGILLWQTNGVIVTDNEIGNNSAAVSGAISGSAFGGGLEAEMGSGGRIERNEFSGNVASQTGIGRGGGASLWGTSNVWVTGNAFDDNAASLSDRDGAGGGLFLLNTSNCRIRENDFENNLAVAGGVGQGGGLCVWSEPRNSDTTVDANFFTDNRAAAEIGGPDPSDGGACYFDVYGLAFTNNVVTGNGADLGGGLYLSFAQDGVLTNNTLVGNSDAAIVVDQYNLTPIAITNNIVVSHTVGISVTQGATATVSYTLWHANGADIAGAGVANQTHPVTGSPAFVDPAADDYHLTIASAARDAGDPAGVPPAPKHDADNVPRPQGPRADIGAYEWKGHWLHLPLVFKSFPQRVGWAIGDDATGVPAIVHTTDGGLTWEAQGDLSAWTGVEGNDISAVDDQTAWAALGSGGAGDTLGAILHTTDGGAAWVTQTIPPGLTGGIKGVKGLSRNEAWAVSLGGTVLHTTDGGATWNIVPHPVTPITEVNRIDALGTNLWIADSAEASATGAIVHTSDSGLTWRAEHLPADGPLTVQAFSPTVVWASGVERLAFYRTVNGGDLWVKAAEVGGLDHLDDVCAPVADDAWGVQNGDGISGGIWRVHVAPNGTPEAKKLTPLELNGYEPGGVTALDINVAWVVAQKGQYPDPTKPLGIILSTTDGGAHWVQGAAPADIRYWKVSFVGARR
jgi:photosystem II stability/assembly factor-like uncharacterized protein